MGILFIVLSVLACLAILSTMPLRAGQKVVSRNVQFIGRLALLGGVAWKVANYLETGLLAYSNLSIAAGVALVYSAQLLHEVRRRKGDEP